MSEYAHVEQPLLAQLSGLGWTIIDHGAGAIPQDPALSLRASFRELVLPGVFRDAIRAINKTADGKDWLTERQLVGLIDDIFRQPNRTLPDANEAVQALLFKAQVDRNEATGEIDPERYARALEKGKLSVQAGDGALTLRYQDRVFPLAPDTGSALAAPPQSVAPAESTVCWSNNTTG